MKLSMKQGVAVGVTALAMAWGVQAQAATTTTLTYANATFPDFVTVRTTTNGGTSFSNSLTGAFNMTASGAGVEQFGLSSPLLAWCVEIATSLRQQATPYTTTWANDQSWYGSVQRLIGVAYDSVLSARSNVMSAAFQLALWELVTENSATKNLADGNFRASGTGTNSNLAASTEAVSAAQGWLTTVNSSTPVDTSQYRIVLFQASNSQDLISLVPTPLPGAALLFASALGLGGLARRARARKAEAATA